MNQTLNDLVNEALFQWVAVTGVDLNNHSFSIRFDGGMSDWDLQEATEALNKSRELDETGLTTWMMLRGLVEHYMHDQAFTAHDIVFNPGPIKKRLDAMHALHTVLEDPLVIELIGTFIEKIRNTAKQYEFKDMTDMEKLLADKYQLSYVRRDALLSMEKLTPHQFTQGEGDPQPVGLNPNVYEFWNINSLIRALRSQNIPGVTTVLVRDPEALHSFFVFAIKNGDNITIFTDKTDDPHPAHRRMSRQKSVVRDFWKRAAQHWFPYQLLKLEIGADQKTLYAEARTALVPINVQAVKMAHVSDLEPAQFVWLMLISELLLEKFWKQNYHTPELAYTGEMVVEPHSLVGETGALVRSGLYKPIVLDSLTKEDVTSESTAHQWERKPTYFYGWMMDRYSNQVPTEVFNVVGETNIKLLQEKHGLQRIDEWGHLIVSSSLEHLDAENFGTRQRLIDDRQWAARVNQTKIVRKLADEEYKKTYKDLMEWYRQRILARGEFFADAAASGSLMGPFASLYRPTDEDGRTISFSFDEHLILETRNLIESQVQHRTYSGSYEKAYILLSFDHFGDVSLSKVYSDYRSGYCCYDRPDVKASIFTLFQPNCPEALAYILGLKLEELPWQVQHWYNCGPGRPALEPYSGNSILGRLDPVDWVLENPWFKLRFRVGVAFSKRAFLARRKALGLPPKDVPKIRKGYGGDDEQ